MSIRLDDYKTPEGFMQDAACRGMGADDWFPSTEAQSTRAAERVCISCPVRWACVDYALKTKQRHGVWGGFVFSRSHLHPRVALNHRKKLGLY